MDKILVTKCTISFKEAIYLIKQHKLTNWRCFLCLKYHRSIPLSVSCAHIRGCLLCMPTLAPLLWNIIFTNEYNNLWTPMAVNHYQPDFKRLANNVQSGQPKVKVGWPWEYYLSPYLWKYSICSYMHLSLLEKKSVSNLFHVLCIILWIYECLWLYSYLCLLFNLVFVWMCEQSAHALSLSEIAFSFFFFYIF